MKRVGRVLVLAALVGCGGGGKSNPDARGDVADRPADTGVGDGKDVAGDAPKPDGAGDVAIQPDAGVVPDATGADLTAAEVSDAPPADVATVDASDAAEVAEPATVRVAFTGTVVTVASTPLGFDATVRTKPVTGTFSYNLGYVDDTLAADRGKFERFGKMSFTMVVDGHTITGSGKGILQTENLASSDTFRYLDGPQNDAAVRTMKLDGVDAPKLKLFVAITDGTATMLTSDALPAPFPAIDIKTKPHTFSLSDDGGTLLMQLDTLVNQ